MPLRTANFITQEDIGGARTDSINAAELRNAPDVTVRRGPAGTILIKIAAVFGGWTSSPPSVSSIRLRSWGNQRARQRAHRSSCGCVSHPGNR